MVRTNDPDNIPDAEKIKEILAVVSDRVPELLRSLSDVLYGTDQAKKFGRAAAVFYKELKGTGMTEEQIFELTRQYLSSLSIGNVVGKFASDHEHGHRDFSEEVGSRVRKRIGKKLKHE
jgi:hypothetical protein